MDVPQKLNEEITTALPVTDAVGTLKPGVYVMIAKPSQKSREDYNTEATQWFIVSDLGLTAFSGDDGVHAFVRSLAETSPSADVNVKLIARNNEVLGTAKTDARGYAKFDAGLARGEGGLQPALLMAESASGEYAFLDLTSGAFDLTDRGVKGRETPGPLDGFVYTERGVYRPGEDVHIAALVRDAAGKAATLPVTLIVTRPDGVEHSRYTLKDRGLGGRDITLPLAASSQTGTWRAKLHTDPQKDPITQVSFLVEDFVPERLDLKLEAPAAALSPQETQTIKATGRYLYGPPAADLAIEGDILVKPSKKDVEGYPGFQFGQAEETIEPVRKPLDAATTTDADGVAQVAITLPPVTQTAKPLEASVILRLRESGGRTIERTITVPVDLKQPRIGIKPLFKGTDLDEKQTASFEVVVLDGEGKRVASDGLGWVLNRLDTNWQWYRRDGQWNYEAVTLTRKVADGTLNATADGALPKIEANVDYGRYKLEITSADPSGPSASTAFNAGWYTAASEAESPEILDVALDRASYKPGDTAKLRIATKVGGKALISVLSGGLLSTQEIDVPNGGGEADVTVGENWGAGAYVTAMLYRPLDESAEAHAEPRHRRAVAGPRPGREHAQRRARRTGEDQVRFDAHRAREARRPESRRGGARHARRRRPRHPQSDALPGARHRKTGSMPSGAWASRSATSTGGSSTACAPSAARCARAATAAPTPACRAARRSKRRWPCSRASSPSAPTAPPASTSTCPTSTARCG